MRKSTFFFKLCILYISMLRSIIRCLNQIFLVQELYSCKKKMFKNKNKNSKKRKKKNTEVILSNYLHNYDIL